MIAACIIASGTGADPTPGPPPYGAPVAAFDPSGGGGFPAYSAIDFTDLSTGFPTSWKWSVNGALAAITQNFSYYFNHPGVYSVRLQVANVYGSDSLIQTYYIGIPPP